MSSLPVYQQRRSGKDIYRGSRPGRLLYYHEQPVMSFFVQENAKRMRVLDVQEQLALKQLQKP